MELARAAIRLLTLTPGLTVIASRFECPNLSPVPLQVLYAIAMLSSLAPQTILWVTGNNSYDLKSMAEKSLGHHRLDTLLSPFDSRFGGIDGNYWNDQIEVPSFFGAIKECENDPNISVLVIDECDDFLSAGNSEKHQPANPKEAIEKLLIARPELHFVLWLRTYFYRRGTKNEIPSECDLAGNNQHSLITLHRHKNSVSAICQAGSEHGTMLLYQVKHGTGLQ